VLDGCFVDCCFSVGMNDCGCFDGAVLGMNDCGCLDGAVVGTKDNIFVGLLDAGTKIDGFFEVGFIATDGFNVGFTVDKGWH